MFKIKNRKMMIAASAAILSIPVVAALAANPTVNVTVTANFRRAISLSSGTNLDFNKVDYSNSTVTSADFVKVGTNSAAIYGGAWTAGAGAVTTAGDVQVVTGDALPVWVECTNTATLKNGAATIQATGIEVTTASASGAFGTGNACQGIGTHAFGFTLAGSGADHIKVGGKLDGGTASGGTIVGGAYSTSGGTPVRVDVYYQ